jgi:hypothetical protein
MVRSLAITQVCVRLSLWLDVQDLVASLGDSIDSNGTLPSRPETPGVDRSDIVRPLPSHTYNIKSRHPNVALGLECLTSSQLTLSFCIGRPLHA